MKLQISFRSRVVLRHHLELAATEAKLDLYCSFGAEIQKIFTTLEQISVNWGPVLSSRWDKSTESLEPKVNMRQETKGMPGTGSQVIWARDERVRQIILLFKNNVKSGLATLLEGPGLAFDISFDACSGRVLW